MPGRFFTRWLLPDENSPARGGTEAAFRGYAVEPSLGFRVYSARAEDRTSEQLVQKWFRV